MFERQIIATVQFHLERASSDIVKRLESNKKRATGRTIKSIHVEGNYLYGRKGIHDLTHGQSSTKAKKRHGSKARLKRELKPWARARDIDEGRLESISDKIYNEGDLLYRTGSDFYNQKGIEFEDIATKKVQELMEEIPSIIKDSLKEFYEH